MFGIVLSSLIGLADVDDDGTGVTFGRGRSNVDVANPGAGLGDPLSRALLFHADDRRARRSRTAGDAALG